EMGKATVGNGNLIALLIHDSLRMMVYTGIAATAAYYTKVVLEDPGFTSWMLIVIYLGSTVGSLISSGIAKKLGSKRTTLMGCILCAVFLALAYFIPGGKIQILVLLFLALVSFGLALGLVANMYSMCGTYSEWKTGANARGIIMAISALSIKIGLAIRSVLIAAILGWIAYDPNMTVMTDTAKSGISLMFTGVFAAIMLISIIPMIFFRLDDKRVETMEAEITARKKAAAEESE
ncbi:MAG: MFS transporter, partial [Oscillospiraceae bacterium]|nr:MFS transporter [Oscillospiraceae bacterium]